MKTWFPFSDYDFYGYLFSGTVIVFACDFWATGGELLQREKWTIAQGFLLFGTAYVAGQIMAQLSAPLIEHGLARKLLPSPSKILLSDKAPSFSTRLGKVLFGRTYFPLPTSMQAKVMAAGAAETGHTETEVRDDPEIIFAAAYTHARKNEDTRKRLDDFRNQHGFNRNMGLTFLISAGLLFDRSYWIIGSDLKTLALLSLLLAIGMIMRFLKFYSMFASEVFRNYAYNRG